MMRMMIVITTVEKVTIGVGGSCAVAVDTKEFTIGTGGGVGGGGDGGDDADTGE